MLTYDTVLVRRYGQRNDPERNIHYIKLAAPRRPDLFSVGGSKAQPSTPVAHALTIVVSRLQAKYISLPDNMTVTRKGIEKFCKAYVSV